MLANWTIFILKGLNSEGNEFVTKQSPPEIFSESHLLVLLDVFKTSFLVAESFSGVVPEK